MDFGGCKAKGKVMKEENLEQFEQMETSTESCTPMINDQKNAMVLEWAEGKPTLTGLIQQEIKSRKKKKAEVRKQEKQEHANEIAWEKLKQKIDEMPKASWKDIMQAAANESAKLVIIESEDSDTDLDGIPDDFEDADQDSEFTLDDDMTGEFPQLRQEKG